MITSGNETSVLFLTRDDGAALWLFCASGGGNGAGVGSWSTAPTSGIDARIYSFAKGHVVNATALVAPFSFTLTASCNVFGEPISSPVTMNQIPFDKAAIRSDAALNWQFDWREPKLVKVKNERHVDDPIHIRRRALFGRWRL
jgi:hypothetical protein